jgi:hypothetical protein
VFFYRRIVGGKRRVVARTDRHAPYRRSLPIRVKPGKHRVYARVFYKRPGGTRVRHKTVSRRFIVCA